MWQQNVFRQFFVFRYALISNRFHEKIRRQVLADLGKNLKAGCGLPMVPSAKQKHRPSRQARICRPPRTFDDEQRADGSKDFHGFGWRLV